MDGSKSKKMGNSLAVCPRLLRTDRRLGLVMTLGSHQTTVGKSQSWVTPKFIIDDLGPFDLDPCACDPQPWPCATVQVTERGLQKKWAGRVWLNPPFNRYEVGLWIGKLAEHGSGIALVHARTEADWFLPIWRRATAIGFVNKRLHFHYPDGQRADANSGAPVVLAAFSEYDKQRLLDSKIPMYVTTDWGFNLRSTAYDDADPNAEPKALSTVTNGER